HPHVLAQPQGEAAGVPLAGSLVQPVPRLLGHADGRTRRDREPHRSGRPARQGHLRALAGGAEGRPEDARLPGRGAGRIEEGSRVPPQGRRVHRGRDRDLGGAQGGEGAEPGAAAADADGVRALLRHLRTAAAWSLIFACACASPRPPPPVSPTALKGVTLGLPVPQDARPSASAGCGQFAPDMPRRLEKALIAALGEAGATIAVRAPWRLAVALTFAGAGAE